MLTCQYNANGNFGGYRVLRDFQSADWPFGGNGATWPFDGKGATINAGQILIFMFESWSYYYGTGFYLFRDATGEICAWDVRDDEDISRWRQFFEEESKDHG